jgi:hypothetical protein
MSHDHYLSIAYAATFAAIVLELVILRVRRAQALKRVAEERDLETQD